MIKTAVREQGLVGTLFEEGRPSEGILILGGSSGGHNEERAEKLAKRGFAALSLAYFGAEHLPSRLAEIPLEYFEKALSFLHSKVGRVGIWGGSRGAEAALILGTLFPKKIQAIVASVPSSAVYGAFDRLEQPAWLYRGKPIRPNAPFSYPKDLGGDTEHTAIRATPFFLEGMKQEKAFSDAMIAVEKIQCPLLLISAQDDQMWPSSLFAEQIVGRLKAHRSPIFCSHLSYSGVGHAPSKGTRGFHPILKKWFCFGGNEINNTWAVEEWFQQTVHFFEENLPN